nr:NADH dehydrogenase subunit 6 [Phlyctenosis sp. N135]
MTTLMIGTMWSMSMMFMFMSHPLSFGLILLVQTLLVSVLTGMMNYNFWFSYILFLIMVGGMLILFIYMTSVASNEKFKFSPKLLTSWMLMMTMVLLLSMTDSLVYNSNSMTYDLMSQSLLNMNEYSLNKTLNMPMSMNMAMIITYLLITMIVVVKITSIQHGPLRQKM